MQFNFADLKKIKSETAVLLISEDIKLSGILGTIDRDKIVSGALKANKAFKGKLGELHIMFGFDGIDTLIIAGIGKVKELDANKLRKVGGAIAVKLNQSKIKEADLYIDDALGINAIESAVEISAGIKLKNYVFDKYYVDKKDEHAISLTKMNVFLNDFKKAKEVFADVAFTIEGTIFTRNLVSEPPNNLYPESFAKECKKFESIGIKVTVLGKKEMTKLGMGALLGVAQGSEREPQLVMMEWMGGTKSQKPLSFVGKGVTFDSGGINIKPSEGMGSMKYDMAGAGVVAGLMYSLALRKAKVNVVGVIALVENMPSGTAQRPSDVVISMSGQSIEVDNTDAEGRLILADALHYTQKIYKPEVMIDLATLTGAIVVALGDGCAGLFSNDEVLAANLIKVGVKKNEKVWQMPLSEYYDKQINSEIADIRNTGTGRGGGSITAAQFLKRFVNKETKWAHLDIAGVAWNKQGTDVAPKGATGFGVQLLNQFIIDYYENK